MRVAKQDEAGVARGSKIFGAFRELMQARMLWAAGGIAIIGIMAGFVFYNNRSHVPFQNQPASPGSTATSSPSNQPNTPEKVLIAEQKPVTQPDSTSTAGTSQAAHRTDSSQVLGETTCDATAKQKATSARDSALQAEEKRFEQLMSQRRGVKQLLSAITGNITSPPSAEEMQKHESIVQQVNTTYQQAITAAHCS